LYSVVDKDDADVDCEYFVDEVINDDAAEIALCTLAGLNLGKIKETSDMERPMELLVRALNEILDYQDYPVEAARNSTLNRRPLGIGISNVAFWLAKNGYKYSDGSSLAHWDDIMEAFQYYAIKGSMEVAKERGAPCAKFHETKYSKGIFPIDTYKKELDTVVHQFDPKMDWGVLRKQVATYGMMNSTLTAIMPTETSAQISNAVNSLEPPRSLVTIKSSGDGLLRQVVPSISKLKNKYELAWDMPNTRGYLAIVAIAGRHIDQSVSASTWYNPQNYQDGDVPMSELIKDDLFSFKVGLKTLYYCHTNDGSEDASATINKEFGDDGCAGGACKL
jgi:ribonucleoside-diphosphate reductase alpha chain